MPFDFSKELFYVRLKKFWPFHEYGTDGVMRGLRSIVHGRPLRCRAATVQMPMHGDGVASASFLLSPRPRPD